MTKTPKPATTAPKPETAGETVVPTAPDAGPKESAPEVLPVAPDAEPAAVSTPLPDVPARPERRTATVASRIDHDGDIWLPDDLLSLTEEEFAPLAKAGALAERHWDDCLPD